MVKTNYFSNKTDLPLIDDMLANPVYFKENKNLQAEIIYMTIEDYFFACAKIHKCGFENEIESVDVGRAKRYAESMESGDKFPLPVLDYSINSQEGRHRAYAVALLNNLNMDTEIPVVIVSKT